MSRPLPGAVRAVLFDLDGVLVDSFDAWVAVLDECRVRRGMPPLGPEPIRATWGQGIAADCRTFFPGELPARLAVEYDRGFETHVGKVKAIPHARELVRTLRAAGLPLALVTNSPVAMARRVLDALAVLDAFSVIAGGDEVPRGKPDPALVHLALSRLGVAAADAVLVGDTRLDADAGAGAGVAVIGYHVRADVEVASLADVPALLGLRPSSRPPAG